MGNKVEIYCPNCEEFFEVDLNQSLPLEMDGSMFRVRVEYPCCGASGVLTIRLDLD